VRPCAIGALENEGATLLECLGRLRRLPEDPLGDHLAEEGDTAVAADPVEEGEWCGAGEEGLTDALAEFESVVY